MGFFDSFDKAEPKGDRDDKLELILERLERIEGKLDRLLGASGEAAQASGEDEMISEIMALMRQGMKINAIKVHRERTGVGLKESKDFVEALWERLR